MKTLAETSCTVAIPVYNQVRFLEKALRSVLDQIVPGIEVIVVDDGSKADVWKALQALVPSSVQLYRNERNLGLFANWNRCLSLAKGEYFGILCADDELAAGYLSAALKCLNERQDVVLVSTRGIVQSEAGRELGRIADVMAAGVYEGRGTIPTLLDFYGRTGRNPFNYPSGVLVRSATAREVRGYDPSMQHVGDLDFFFRLMGRGNLAVLDTVGCRVTAHAGQAGVVRAVEPIGMRELQGIIGSIDQAILPEDGKRALQSQYRSLSLIHALGFLCRRNWSAALRYWRDATEDGTGIARLALGFCRILAGKYRAKRVGGYWQRRFDAQRR